MLSNICRYVPRWVGHLPMAAWSDIVRTLNAMQDLNAHTPGSICRCALKLIVVPWNFSVDFDVGNTIWLR
jgi:hypothetical protein